MKNKLDLGNTNMYILRNKSENYDAPLKELVISAKTIFRNTYNLTCMDISTG